MEFFDRILRAGEGRKVKALQSLVPDINAHEAEISRLSDDALRAKTDEFRNRLANGEELDDILRSLSVTREAAHRVIGQRQL